MLKRIQIELKMNEIPWAILQPLAFDLGLWSDRAWQNHKTLSTTWTDDPRKEDLISESWVGPASVTFHDKVAPSGQIRWVWCPKTKCPPCCRMAGRGTSRKTRPRGPSNRVSQWKYHASYIHLCFWHSLQNRLVSHHPKNVCVLFLGKSLDRK